MSERESCGVASYWVPLHVRLCVTATGTVALDLKRTRYFGVGATETRTLATLALNWLDASVVEGTSIEPMPLDAAAEYATALVKAGLLADTPPVEASLTGKVSSTGADRSGIEPERLHNARLRARHVLTLARALYWAKRAIRARDLYSIVHEVARDKAQLSPSLEFAEKRAVESVSAFRRLRPHVFASQDQCLLHALTLTKFLMHSGLAATWVIAVRPRPWAAHSWVQLDNLLLDTNPEEINGYTPILSV